MARGGRGKHNNNNDGGNRGGRGGPPVRGGGGGRGGFRGRGIGGGRGRGGGGPPNAGSSMLMDDIQIIDRMFSGGHGPNSQTRPYSPATPNTGRGRGRGRGRGQDPDYSPSPRGRGRGMGIGSPSSKATPQRSHQPASLSSLLHTTRPLLRPVIFVPSERSRVLFADEDDEDEVDEAELIVLMGEDETNDANEQEFIAHAPTADTVSRVFSGNFAHPALSLEDEDEGEDAGNDDETLEEIDFSDLSKLVNDADDRAKTKTKKVKGLAGVGEEEEQFTGFFVRPKDQPEAASASASTTTTTTTTIESTVSTSSSTTEEVVTEASISTTKTSVSASSDAADKQGGAEKDVAMHSESRNPTPTPPSTSADVGKLASAVDDAPVSVAILAVELASSDSVQPREILTTPETAFKADATSAMPAPISQAVSQVKEIESNPPLEFAPRSLIDDNEVEVEESSSTINVDTDPSPTVNAEIEHSPLFVIDTEPSPGFIIDTDPSLNEGGAEGIEKPRIRTPSPIRIDRQADEDDEIIVYVAPHPRKSEVAQAASAMLEKKAEKENGFTPYQGVGFGMGTAASASKPQPSISDFTFSFATPSITSAKPASNSLGTPARLSVPPVATPRMQKAFSAKEKKSLKRLKEKERRKKRKSGGGGGGFGVLGAMMQEKELHDEYDFAYSDGEDPRWGERRRGDSDLEWGNDDGEDEVALGEKRNKGKGKGKSKAKAKANDGFLSFAQIEREEQRELGEGVDPTDMDVDVDVDLKAMQRFVGGMIGKNAGVHISFGDIADIERIRQEDEEEEKIRAGRGSSGESDSEIESIEDEKDEEEGEEGVLAREEQMIIEEYDRVVGEDSDSDEDEDNEDEEELDLNEALEFALGLDNGDDEDLDDDDEEEDEDEEATPQTKFAKRLQKFREQSSKHRKDVKGKGRAVDFDDDDEEDEDGFLDRNMGWAMDEDDYDDEDALIVQLNDMLDENADILKARNRKERKNLFKAIETGSFEYDEFFPRARRGKDKRNGVPHELREQWDKDRAKKAAYKAQREAEKLARAADPFSEKKGGKKGRKAMLAAASASFDNPITILAASNRIIDITSLVQMIRRFVADVGGKSSMSLPPTSKDTRKNVHELAIAFGLKSVSKGKGEARYVTLNKTTRTGLGRIDEKKVARVVRRAGGAGASGNDFGGGRGGGGGGRGGGRVHAPKHKEGDEVGGKAPKIDATNVGFRMLAMMGWAEGQRIGGGEGGEGLADPLVAIVKHSKLGLGASRV